MGVEGGLQTLKHSLQTARKPRSPNLEAHEWMCSAAEAAEQRGAGE